MKKIVFLICFLFSVFSASAQFSVNKENVPLTDQAGVDFVIIINGIDASTGITYTADYSSINWYKFSDPDTSISNVDYISPDDATGYILDVDGERKTIWVIDYREYLPNLTEIEPDPDVSTCETTVLRINSDAVPPMTYYALGSSLPRYVKREFTIRYSSKDYEGESWNNVDRTEEIAFPTQNIEVPASLDPAAVFTLSGDQFAETFMFDFSVRSNNTPIVAIEEKLTAFVTVRDALNEVERPKENEPTPPITGSAPIEILFESRPSDDNALVEWKIYREGESNPFITRTDRDQRYTFTTAGRYDVALSVDNGYCSDTITVQVEVRESLLEVPNVFTPNGDGVNDEFRVTFRSLESFHCWVFNNWGKQVYEWTDPAKGWNGRVGSRKAPSGTYFYIIKAKGTDGVKYNLKGDVSIIR